MRTGPQQKAAKQKHLADTVRPTSLRRLRSYKGARRYRRLRGEQGIIRTRHLRQRKKSARLCQTAISPIRGRQCIRILTGISIFRTKGRIKHVTYTRRSEVEWKAHSESS